MNQTSIEETIVNTDNVDKKVWLVKVPAFVAEKWAQVKEPGVELGKVRIYNTPASQGNQSQGGGPTVTMHISDAPWSTDLPKNYTLKFTNTNPSNEYVFTQDRNTQKALSVTGKVHHEATIAPIIDDDYRRIMQTRTEAASQPQRTIKLMDKNMGKNRQFIVPNLDQGGFGIMRRTKSAAEKRERLPRDDLLNLIFSAFAKYEHWTLKSLVEHTQQPQAWLKEVLCDVATLNKRGPYLGTYSLKPEFKSTKTLS